MEKVIKVLILGANGMLGHVVYETLSKNPEQIQVNTTSRKTTNDDVNDFYFDPIVDINGITQVIKKIKPDYVINCIGQLVQGSLNKPKDAIILNALLPHFVASLSAQLNFRFIHISTDCVFNGKNGPYDESDSKNEENYYGLTKNLGEVVNYQNCLTIRTSIIGPEIRENKTGLFEWVLSKNSQTVNGYKNVIWSGLTTIALANFMKEIIFGKVHFNEGLIHATNNIPINKYDLIKLIVRIFDLQIDLVEDFDKVSNKQLINTIDLDYDFESYENMIFEMKEWIGDHKELYVKA